VRLFLLPLLLAFTTPAFAYDQPRDVVMALYTPFLDAENWEYTDPAPLQSAGLNALIEQDRKDADGEIGRLDFDPYVVGQDFLLSDFEVGAIEETSGTARITVTFRNFDAPETNVFTLIRETDGWKIDDVANLDDDGAVNYSLRAILSQPFP
jgi:hypothetical protein